MRLVLASTNQGKRREIEALLAPQGISVATATELGFDQEVEETGDTFAANAELKARAVSRALGLPAIADDSGLCVHALEGAPGVYSARYARPGADDATNNAKLLEALAGVAPEQRGAVFVCVMVCCRPDGRLLTAQGRLEGRIALKADGEGGFGYDPVFELPECGLTVARLSTAEKNAISHRGQAMREIVARIWEFLHG